MQVFRTAIPRLGARAFSTTVPRPLARMQLIGRLGDAPEVQDTASGRQLVKYNLAVSTGGKDENGNRNTSWFKIASFPSEGQQKDFFLSLPKGLVDAPCLSSICGLFG